MKAISEELLHQILEHINNQARIIDDEFGFSPFGGISVIREKEPDNEAVLLFDKIKAILDEKE